MRTNRPVAAMFLIALSASPAMAEITVAGNYDVKFEEMSTNCDPPRFSYNRGAIRIDVVKNSLRVNIDTIPQMIGVPAKSGKVTARMQKKQATTVQGLDGKYSVSGRVDDSGVLQLVLVAEFTKAGETKTMCTQSWNVSGVRQTPSTGSGTTKKSVLDSFMPQL